MAVLEREDQELLVEGKAGAISIVRGPRRSACMKWLAKCIPG